MAKQAKSASAQKSPLATAAATDTEDAVALLTADHRKVEQLFEEYKSASTPQQKAQLARQVCAELIVHTLLEEELFYPACREKGVEASAIDEAQVEHDEAKILISDLLREEPQEAYFDAKVTVLSEYIKHHVQEEEKAGNGIFARATAAGIETRELAQRINERKAELMPQVQGENIRLPRVRSLDIFGMRGNRQESDMDRRYDRDRDEQGRFMSEARRGGYGRDDDDRDDNGYERSSGRSRGHGGWYGDSEEHSRAAEERWRGEGRSYSGRGGDYDEDRYGRGRDYYEYRRSGGGGERGRGGWSGDPEGHSRASEEGWQHREGRGGGYSGRGRDYDEERRSGGGGGRGHGGWFGDPEGHSRASEEGWQHREGRGGGYSGRGRDYDEDRRSGGGGRGHGGWFGDPEGHARAAEEGWRERGGSRYR